jgi:septal ring factor EnvC (AmiA/AmiB activator)
MSSIYNPLPLKSLHGVYGTALILFLISALENKIKARQKTYNDLMEQIKTREEHLDRMAKEERALEKEFCKMAEDEVKKESAARKDYRVRKFSNTFKLPF